jgi:leucyl aminopeptidase
MNKLNSIANIGYFFFICGIHQPSLNFSYTMNEKNTEIHLCICPPENPNYADLVVDKISYVGYWPELDTKYGSKISFEIKKDAYVTAITTHPNNDKANCNAVRSCLKNLKGKVNVHLLHHGVSDSILKECIAGIYLSDYIFGSQKSNLETSSISLITENIDPSLLKAGKDLADSLRLCMQMIDLPSNIKTPDYMVDWVQKIADDLSIECTILDAKLLRDQGFGAIVGVGQASIYGSYLCILKYRGNPKLSNFDLALVGKGVTFDTGGVSLKDSTNMHYMKSDLGGAAAMISAVHLISKNGRPINVIAVVPFVENAIDGNAIRPGDVLKTYDNKTIEVIDTDAEGRLILADALAYLVKNHTPTTIIDAATLTGNCVQALGNTYAGLFSTNNILADQLFALGEQSGDYVWRMPMHEDYFEMMKSDIADIKNFHGRPYAGAITAAKFLEYFTDGHAAYAHLDIAGVAFGDSDLLSSKTATGFGIRLLDGYAAKISDH